MHSAVGWFVICMMAGQLESRVKLDESHDLCSRIGWWRSQANEELTHGRPGHGGEPKRRLYFRISHFTSPFYFSHCVLLCNLASFSHPANFHVHISRIHRLREFLCGSPDPSLPSPSPSPFFPRRFKGLVEQRMLSIRVIDVAITPHSTTTFYTTVQVSKIGLLFIWSHGSPEF